jgi:hypothetical protein
MFGGEYLWRGSLLPSSCEAVAIPASAVYLNKRRGRFAAQREQAPSPQGSLQPLLRAGMHYSLHGMIAANARSSLEFPNVIVE